MQRWARRLVGGGALLVVAGTGLWASGAGSASGAGTTMMSISPASQNVAMGGDPFKVDVAVSNVENLGAFEITVTFNKDVLEYVGIAKGPFLSSTGRAATCVSPYPGRKNTLTPVENVNRNGAFHFGCNTRGESAPGPNRRGELMGVLMTVGFKPKAPGLADLAFQGDAPRYAHLGDTTPIPGTGPYKISVPGNDNGEYGQTGLADAEGSDLVPDMRGGVVQVYDPNAPVPTAVPATPTVVPAPPPRDIRATTEAVLGTHERRLDATSIAGAFSSTGSGDGSSGSGGSNGGGVAGATAGGVAGSGGRTGDITTQGAGGTSAGGSRSASGAPIAGFGPDAQPGNPWPGRASLALILVGVGAVITGAAGKRRAAPESK